VPRGIAESPRSLAGSRSPERFELLAHVGHLLGTLRDGWRRALKHEPGIRAGPRSRGASRYAVRLVLWLARAGRAAGGSFERADVQAGLSFLNLGVDQSARLADVEAGRSRLRFGVHDRARCGDL
jgi:hypothetical protein